ncbi:hypothetical protein N2152v2_000200 [Parachlorella kessleri]
MSTLPSFVNAVEGKGSDPPGAGESYHDEAGSVHEASAAAYADGPRAKRRRLQGTEEGEQGQSPQQLSDGALALALQQAQQQAGELVGHHGAQEYAAETASDGGLHESHLPQHHMQQHGEEAGQLQRQQHAAEHDRQHQEQHDMGHDMHDVMLVQQQLMAQMQQQHDQQLGLEQQQQQYGHPAVELHYQVTPTEGHSEQQQGPTAQQVAAAAAAAGLDAQQALAEHAAAQQAQQQQQGQHAMTVALPILGAAEMPQLAFDPAAIAAATAAGAAVTIPLSMLEGLTPEALQMLGAGNGLSLVAGPGGGFPLGQLGGQGGAEGLADPSMQYKNWWDEEHEKASAGKGPAGVLFVERGLEGWQGPTRAQYTNWWDEGTRRQGLGRGQQELLELVNNREYCKQRLGTEDLDWTLLEQHFNRSQNALRKKYWMLSKQQQAAQAQQAGAQQAQQQPGRGAAGPGSTSSGGAATTTSATTAAAAGGGKQRAERKNWTEAEAAELLRFTQDPAYMREKMGQDDLDWEAVASYFKTSIATVKRKYRHLLEQQQLAAQAQAQQLAAAASLGLAPHHHQLAGQPGFPPPAPGEKSKRQHHRKNVPYRWMIVTALSGMDNMEGTALEIFARIESSPQFVDQLDTRIMPGTKHVPRWKIQVRKVLSADNIFINTGRKHKHETIWRLDPAVNTGGAQSDRSRQRGPRSSLSPPAPGGHEPSPDMATSVAAAAAVGAPMDMAGAAAAAAAAAAAVGMGGGAGASAGHAQHAALAAAGEHHLGLLHEQLQHLPAGAPGLSMEHLLGSGAEAAAAAAAAAGAMSANHHQQQQQDDGGAHLAGHAMPMLSPELHQLMQLQEAQQHLGFTVEQLQAAQVVLPEHLAQLQQQLAAQQGIAHHDPSMHDMDAAGTAAQEHDAALLDSQSAGQQHDPAQHEQHMQAMAAAASGYAAGMLPQQSNNTAVQ